MRALLLSALLLVTGPVFAQKNETNMELLKMNAGIITEKLQETKAFYTGVLGFEVVFENDFYLLLQTPGKTAEISFLLPRHQSQQAPFREPFTGRGVYLTIEVPDVNELYEKLTKQGVHIQIELRNEYWGDRHFAIMDPNGIGIDIVTYTQPGD